MKRRFASTMPWHCIPTYDPCYSNINKVNYHFNKEYAEDSGNRYGALELVQIGDLSCEAGYNIGAHLQTSHELTCLLSGSMKIQVNDKIHSVEAGHLCISPTGTEHALYATSAARFQYLAFRLPSAPIPPSEADAEGNPAALSRTSRTASRIEASMLALRTQPVQRCSVIAQLLDLLLEEIAASPTRILSSEVVTGLLQALIIRLIRLHKETRVSPAAATAFQQAQEAPVVYQLLRSVRSFYRNDIRIGEIAGELGYTPAYLSRAFKQATGQTLQSYLLEIRIRRAYELLESGRHSIGEISAMLGYRNQQSFSRAFRKVAGCSPSAYQKKLNQNTQ